MRGCSYSAEGAGCIQIGLHEHLDRRALQACVFVAVVFHVKHRG